VNLTVSSGTVRLVGHAPEVKVRLASAVVVVAVASGCGASSRQGSPADGPLLQPAPFGDGDSWKDTRGREYRLGLVNTPELDECFGSESRAQRQRLVADGFRAEVYDTDRYGRAVAVVTLADGRNLNVLLAREGFADDRYLAEYRSDNLALARALDGAFAAAQRERRGLWGECAARR
jgi:endonuclease YncB( thermonuclease family)